MFCTFHLTGRWNMLPILVALGVLFAFNAFAEDYSWKLDGKWYVSPDKTKALQQPQNAQFMLFEKVFSKMFIEVDTGSRLINFGLEGIEPDFSVIEDIEEQPDGASFTLYIDHEPIYLTLIDNNTLQFVDEPNGIFLVLTKQK